MSGGRTVTVRAAIIGAIILAGIVMLITAGVSRAFEPVAASYVAPITPTASGPHITYSDQGAWRVPGQVAPGQYNIWAGDRECSWQRLKSFSTAKSAVLEEGSVPPHASRRVLVYKSDRVFVTRGPCEWELTS